MASVPLKRDYSLGSEFFARPTRQTLSFRQPSESRTPQRVGHNDDSVSISETEDEFGLDGAGDEPTMDHRQLDMLSSGDARPAILPDIKRKPGLSSPSVTTASVLSYDADIRSSTGISPSKLPDFFSQTVFQTVLQNPTISHQLLKYSQTRLCGENMEFLASVTKYHSLLNDTSKNIYEIHKDYISDRALNQINLAEQSMIKVNHETKNALASTLPQLEAVFADAQHEVEHLVYSNIYADFVRHQMGVSAAKALGSDQSKYGGLGDCFVLTDPTKADNPIVFASDGFVKVTGFSRADIIPRNCRFLQGQHTDQSSVKRLKRAIAKEEESVELILNRKKDGTPFWNLLYVTPLFAQPGQGRAREPVFFLGGQINCSSTIHSQSDVLRILGQQKDEELPNMQKPQPPLRQPRSRSILNALRGSTRVAVSPKPAGMEGTLLNRMEQVPLEHQMSTFYNAYSSYIVINYSTFIVSFISQGLTDLLFPIKAKTAYHTQAVGSDVFRFLSAHTGNGSLSWDFKSAVKGALRMGQAITLELQLCARPLMGLENFALHWTPLKDEAGAVHWIVLTLGNERRVGLAI